MELGEHKHCYQDEYYPQQWRSQEVHRYNPLKGPNAFASVFGWNKIIKRNTGELAKKGGKEARLYLSQLRFGRFVGIFHQW
jgi:hypothetical protein